MTQINFRVDDFIAKFIEYKAKFDGKSKSAISKEIFQKGLKGEMMPYLANLYKKGKISIKYIAYLTDIHPSEIYNLLPKYIDDVDMEDDLMVNFGEIGQELTVYLKELKEKGISFGDGILLNE